MPPSLRTMARERAATVTGLSLRTVDRLIAANKLRSVVIGRRRLVYRESVEALLRGEPA